MVINRKDGIIFLFLIGLIVLYFSKVFFGGYCYFEYDIMQEWYPWQVFTQEMLRNRTVPLWDPFTHCGKPHLANLQTAVFYPLAILFFT